MTAAAPALTDHARPAPSGARAVPGDLVDLDGRRFSRIRSYDELPPFLMTVVSSDDLWMFVSSTGGLTAGRVDPDGAVFPYGTEDKVAEGAGRTGGLSVLRVRSAAGQWTSWQPFAERRPGDVEVARDLYKDTLGTTLVFEETRADLGLRLRVSWQAGARYGVVRSCVLSSSAPGPTEVEMLDGVVNIVPAGASARVQNELSTLVDAYKRNEVDPATGLGTYAMSSALTDLAEPSESLEATVAWQVGLDPSGHLLCTRQLPAFRDGRPVVSETDVRGERGAYLTRTRFTLAAGQDRRWSVVVDARRDSAAVVDLREELRDPAGTAARLQDDVARTRAGVEAYVAAADGVQRTGDELATMHHAANVLFNVMRGGIPVAGYVVSADDVRDFVLTRSPVTARRCAAVLDALPPQLRIDELVALAERHGDPDLHRLAREYLPLTFSRRHGDPSRPWNRFRIVVRDEHGAPRLDHQGNWRDIFQNWEALAWSHPELVESMVTVFLDATTVDGYNPYRIGRDGVDWEVPEPEDPWSNIGYWSDHQIVYLLKLLETSRRFHPGRLDAWLNRPVFTAADVPYRIAGYAATVEDPYDTITYDHARAAAVAERVARLGPDGRLVHTPGGDLLRVTLGEKLLLLLLAKLVNLVPGGGIWMNTQRPEWNDANNALVGRGLSVVTLAYLRRYLDLLDTLPAVDLEVTGGLADLLESVLRVLQENTGAAGPGVDDVTRRRVMDGLGAAGTAYRERAYAGVDGTRTRLAADRVRDLVDVARRFVDAGLRANRREDGLYHSYNLLDLGAGRAAVDRLPEMLEGQVAVLSSGLLDAREASGLLTALRRSRLYRADQHSYLLYPDKELPGFLRHNRVPAERAAGSALVTALVEAGDRSVVVRDVRGDVHFSARIRNARVLRAELDRLAADPRWADLVQRDATGVLDLFEETFRHAAFTGRSGTFFAFEGLGSIYWHMVSKLLLATQECLERAAADGADPEVQRSLAGAYEDLRTGLGYCKSAREYGAFPTDPYSHTPAGSGARQPGMTGQVKEGVLTRLGELGLRVEAGRIVVRPLLLRPQEWTASRAAFPYRDVAGHEQVLDLPAGSLAFTFCQVPVVYRRGRTGSGLPEVRARLADGTTVDGHEGALDPVVSSSVFRRDGRVVSIDATIPTGVPALDGGAAGG